MNNLDLFADIEPEIAAPEVPAAPSLPAEEQHRLDRVVKFTLEGHLLDAQVEASIGSSDTSDAILRERFDRLAKALWDARAWIDAWRVIDKQRRSA